MNDKLNLELDKIYITYFTSTCDMIQSMFLIQNSLQQNTDKINAYFYSIEYREKNYNSIFNNWFNKQSQYWKRLMWLDRGKTMIDDVELNTNKYNYRLRAIINSNYAVEKYNDNNSKL